MKSLLIGIFIVVSAPLLASEADHSISTIVIPYMEVNASHRLYTDHLLAKAMEASVDKYGPYKIVQQEQSSVLKRHLLDLEKGSISVATSMPIPEWMDNALAVRIPLMKGLASYRLFLGGKKHWQDFDKVKKLADLKRFNIGQGDGWSTGKILEDNGFNVVYGPSSTLLAMLEANRFQLLMRGIFEAKPDLAAQQKSTPELLLVDQFAVYTYLPMYFFVGKDKPELAGRLEYGLKKLHASGQMDALFNAYFADDLKLLNNKKTKVFYINNTNIDPSFFEHDKPYLLESIVKLEKKRH
ncbi:hypothetical protein [Cellvibrio sp. NN19]|uniref:substrate-binding periplasmic protein n=1 Tax=Cellvibrio chitinivorans TaxID=3102792 RepID=UPI002B40C5A1|nr:hypothetical protein [Cellvibrio sp. NN19]